ncbi:hypothetical protein I552_1099 [Mycobacterium xenopi 3993]|nr:hypothetical protein I552_1099 [Mycobacterium xenopi 3993]
MVFTAQTEVWHPGHMPGKEIDPIRARSALEVVRQHPAMVLFAASPAIAAVAAVWVLAGVAGRWSCCWRSPWPAGGGPS